ncbi:hypothetical protein AM500_18475 [Bacillus sp. FJAT-18017]|uniref:hypothetical protein n=1 Tax=Bacillus sp. FJAT-18017 TaxID=1705566 RepID=UPI0006AF4F2B|nr:hypothetical protein [Bacillus sp. FJAT-18017]ALC91547.1 hypothetical protein AM500_18475 [Bacillus sp. FJAT-18017]
MEKKLIFAGAETEPQNSGHLEGALQSAEHAVIKINNLNMSYEGRKKKRYINFAYLMYPFYKRSQNL